MKELGVDLAMRIATEHLSYRSLIEEIEGQLERVRCAEVSSREDLLALLVTFSTDVRRHFALEEKGGLFEVYLEHDHALRQHARTMLDQHRDFVERLRRIIDDVRSSTGSDDPGLAGCARDLRQLFRELREHEKVEDELLDYLVEQDIRR